MLNSNGFFKILGLTDKTIVIRGEGQHCKVVFKLSRNWSTVNLGTCFDITMKHYSTGFGS